MAEDLIKQASTKILSWMLGIVASGILGLIGLVGTFYVDWKTDEAVEDEAKYQEKALMFDHPSQKENVIDHVEEAMTGYEQQVKALQDEAFKKEVLKQLKDMAHIDTLNADQMFQIKEELEKIKNHN